MGVFRWRRLEAAPVFTHTPPNVARTQKVVLDADAIQRSVRRIAVAILEATSGIEDLRLIGIRRGNAPNASLDSFGIEDDLLGSSHVGRSVFENGARFKPSSRYER